MLSLHLISRMYVFAHFCTHLFTHIEITDFRAYLCTYFYVLNVLTYLLAYFLKYIHTLSFTYLQDHGWCLGYTCRKRVSTFYSVVAMGECLTAISFPKP